MQVQKGKGTFMSCDHQIECGGDIDHSGNSPADADRRFDAQRNVHYSTSATCTARLHVEGGCMARQDMVRCGTTIWRDATTQYGMTRVSAAV